MANQIEQVGHPDLVGGNQTALHSHAGGGGGPSSVKLTGDANFTSTTLANVTGVSFSLIANNYYKFEFSVAYRSAANATGLKLGLTFPAVTRFAATVRIPAAAAGVGGEYQGWITASGGSVTAANTAVLNTDYLARIDGVIIPSANGTLQLQAATEVANSAITIRQGTCGLLYSL